jgi:hypothetical protein
MGPGSALALLACPGRREKLPDGQITFGAQITLSSPSRKNIPLNPSGKSMLFLRVSHPNEGRIAIVTNVR